MVNWKGMLKHTKALLVHMHAVTIDVLLHNTAQCTDSRAYLTSLDLLVVVQLLLPSPIFPPKLHDFNP